MNATITKQQLSDQYYISGGGISFDALCEKCYYKLIDREKQREDHHYYNGVVSDYQDSPMSCEKCGAYLATNLEIFQGTPFEEVQVKDDWEKALWLCQLADMIGMDCFRVGMIERKNIQADGVLCQIHQNDKIYTLIVAAQKPIDPDRPVYCAHYWNKKWKLCAFSASPKFSDKYSAEQWLINFALKNCGNVSIDNDPIAVRMPWPVFAKKGDRRMFATDHEDIFRTKAAALVNPVNCVGVMGKGLALQFKNRYPSMFEEYAKACNRGDVKPGKMFIWENNCNRNHKKEQQWIVNFRIYSSKGVVVGERDRGKILVEHCRPSILGPARHPTVGKQIPNRRLTAQIR